MPLGSASRPKVGVVVGLTLAALAAVLVPIQGSDMGVAPPEGCTCHSDTPSAAVTVIVEGWPAVYTPGASYLLNVTATGDVLGTTAGFSMEVSKGSLSSSDPDVRASGRVATHTSDAKNRWPVLWIAPPEDSGGVTLTAYVNLVNGDGSEDPGDHWNVATYTATEKAPEPPKPSYLNLSVDAPGSVAVAGQNFSLEARLVNFTGAPIPNATVAYELHVAYGVLDLGEARTDANGTARLNWSVVSAGRFLFMAEYGGSSKNESSNATYYAEAADPDGVFHRYYGRPSVSASGPFDPVRLPLILIVGGVWMTFLFAMRQVLAARKLGQAADDGPRDLVKLVFSRADSKEKGKP